MIRLIDKFEEHSSLQHTDDSLIFYDWLTEQFEVNVDEKTVAIIYGGNRSFVAKRLADLVRNGAFKNDQII